MDATRFHQLEELFGRALGMSPAERLQYIHRECGEDVELRQKALAMLAVDASCTGELEGSISNVALGFDGALESGERLGRYRIVQHVGRGGMGEVYRAVRDDEEFEKEVAVKVLGAGSASPEAVERFRAERQILARLEHPNVARLHDGGTTAEGEPYVVMEYVDGQPIDVYCEENGLDTRERLVLFRKVSEAVHFAHQNLVVHRDIKPGNVLVTSEGEPKLLDFGIAKLLRPEADGETRRRQQTSQLLTPEYASPEQVSGQAIATTSDVYSLGVLLYRLLTGELPYRVVSNEPAELLRAILEQDPEPPSTARRRTAVQADAAEAPAVDVSAKDTTAARPSSTRSRTPLHRDLDAITLKALQKEPGRRYASAEQLSEDIERFLTGLPVRARPDTWSYRVRKFVRRNRAGVAASVTTFLALLAGVVTVSWQARVAAAQRDRALAAERLAEERLESAAAVNRFLQRVLIAPDPRQEGLDVTVRSALENATSRIGDELSDQPVVEAAVHTWIGSLYRSLSAWEEAERELESALELHAQAGGDGNLDALEAEYELAILRMEQGRFEEAMALAQRVIAGRSALLGPRDSSVAAAIELSGQLQMSLGHFEEAAATFEEAIGIRRAADGSRHADTLVAIKHRGTALLRLHRYDEAAALLQEVLQAQRELLGDRHMDTLITVNDLALVLGSQGESEEALALLREAADGFAAVLPRGHFDLLVTRYNLASRLERSGRAEEALAAYDSLLAEAEESLPEGHYFFGYFRFGSARAAMRLERYSQAEPMLEAAIEVLTATLGPEHEKTLTSFVELARLYRLTGRDGAAETVYRDFLERAEPVLGPQSAEVLAGRLALADLLREARRVNEARDLFEKVASDTSAFADRQRQHAAALLGLGRSLSTLGDSDRAESVLLEAIATLDSLADNKGSSAEAVEALVSLYEEQGNDDGVRRWRSRLVRRQSEGAESSSGDV